MRMSGKIETSPYRLSLRNVYDDSKEINSLITFDTEKKLLEAQTSYDIGNCGSKKIIFRLITLNKI